MDDKTEYPFEIKKDDLNLVVDTTIDPILTTTKSIDNSQIGSVGSSFTWNIEADIPEKTNLLTSYIITDTMSTSLTYESLELKLGETVLDASKYSVTQEGQKLTITILNPNDTLSGVDSLTVNVLTTLNSNIATVSATNSAKLEYTYNEIPQNTDESEAKLSVGTVKITKTNASGEIITTGATFEIYTNKEGIGAPLIFINAEGTESTTVTTGIDGIAYIKGLATGTYYLKETAAPDGYNLPTTLKEVKIEADEQVLDVTVVNKTGITLPNTGTLGTILCAVIGIGLIAISIKKIKCT